MEYVLFELSKNRSALHKKFDSVEDDIKFSSSDSDVREKKIFSVNWKASLGKNSYAHWLAKKYLPRLASTLSDKELLLQNIDKVVSSAGTTGLLLFLKKSKKFKKTGLQNELDKSLRRSGFKFSKLYIDKKNSNNIIILLERGFEGPDEASAKSKESNRSQSLADASSRPEVRL